MPQRFSQQRERIYQTVLESRAHPTAEMVYQQLKPEIGGGYDMVVANIVADVIIGLSGQVRPFLKEDGLFLCSGIIDDRAEEVARRLREAGWDILRTRQSEGWFSYLCR